MPKVGASTTAWTQEVEQRRSSCRGDADKYHERCGFLNRIQS